MYRPILLALILAPAAASAVEVDFEGFYRARARAYSSLSIGAADSEGTAAYIQHRAFLRPRFLVSDEVTVMADIRALDGVVWGSTPAPTFGFEDGIADPLALSDSLNPPTGDPLVGLSIWRFWAEAQVGDHTVRVGRMPLHWGSGVWWNDGLGLVSDYGDSADRIQWEGLFGDIYASAAIDWYANDVAGDGALLTPADDMVAVNGMVAYRSETLTGGLALQLRSNPNPGLTVFTADAAFEAEIGKIDLSAEFIARFGSGVLEPADGVQNQNEESITAGGGVLEGGVEFDFATLSLMAGLATGDGDSGDGSRTAFAFDRDFNVGVILFEQPLPTLGSFDGSTGELIARDTSQAQVGDRVTNTLFLRPSVRRTFFDDLELEASLLYARALVVPDGTEFEGRRTYGYEVDATARWLGTEHVDLALTGALFLPGDYLTSFQDLDLSGPVFGGQLTARVRF